MSYEIIIKQKRDVKKLVGKDWVKLGQKEIERDERYWAQSELSNQPRTFLSDEMGYSPEIEKTVSEEREVYRQTVDELDISKVITAVNDL